MRASVGRGLTTTNAKIDRSRPFSEHHRVIEWIRNRFFRAGSKASADSRNSTDYTSPREAEITPLFVNMAGYVRLAEALPAKRLGSLMNEYYEFCDEIIREEGGTLDKFIGDKVVGMFGAPQWTSDHPLRGSVAALKIQRRMAVWREKLQAAGDWPEHVPLPRVRIGLNSGTAIVSKQGTTSSPHLTMMGFEVNFAARMESGAKSWGAWTMCTERTRDAAMLAGQDRVFFRELGNIFVKGLAGQLKIYEPMALQEDTTEQMRECAKIFEYGLSRYRQSDWDGAIKHYKRVRCSNRINPLRESEFIPTPRSCAFRMLSTAGQIRAIGSTEFLFGALNKTRAAQVGLPAAAIFSRRWVMRVFDSALRTAMA